MTTDLKFFEQVRMAMEKGEPVARYIKGILGRVSVKVLDPLSGSYSEIVLSGDPTKAEESAIVTLWTPLELAYFERANQLHLLKGTLTPYTTEIVKVISPNTVTDDEIKLALKSKFFTVKNMLDRFTSPAPVQRMLAIAESMNKPVKTIEAIKGKLAELQEEEYKSVEVENEE